MCTLVRSRIILPKAPEQDRCDPLICPGWSVQVVSVLRELRKERPTVKLLYVTPEQLVKGTRLQTLLGGLHARGRLARFVIDEVRRRLPWVPIGYFPRVGTGTCRLLD